MKRDDLEQLASALGGLSILGCLPGSPGHRAGLRYGDVLLEVDGAPTPNLDAYIEAVRKRGDSMQLKVFRMGQIQLLELPLEKVDADMNAPSRLLNRIMQSGVLPSSMTPEPTYEPSC